MRLLFLGDIVGRAGRTAVIEAMPRLRADWKLDFVVVNGENSASGFGMTPKIADELFAAGADVVTLGDHAFDQKEMLGAYRAARRSILRPLNFAPRRAGPRAWRLHRDARAQACWSPWRWAASS